MFHVQDRIVPFFCFHFALLVNLHGSEPIAPTIEVEPLSVTALRGPSALVHSTFSVTIFDANDFDRSPAWTTDDFLRQIPSFSLFRRTSSIVANPTSQGVSLRGIGPSGTSRSLVLVDGVPLNDAFGGWVNWSQINFRQAERIEVVRGGGSAAWGNTALGGVIHIIPRRPEQDTVETQFTIGNQGTWESSLLLGDRNGPVGISLEARTFSTDGFTRIAPGQRGPVDIASHSRHDVIHLTADYEFPGAARMTLRFTTFDESRGNGTPMTRNAIQSERIHLKMESDPSSDFTWRFDGFATRTDFQSTFSNINGERTNEILVLDQFSVPSHAIGCSLLGTWKTSDYGAITLGTDWLGILGRTNERVILAGDNRIAGGRQLLGGIHLGHDWQPSEATSVQCGLRLDYWRSHDGFLDSPNAQREDFKNREQLVLNSRAGVTHQATDDLHLRASTYQAFRAPTLNELYRPFQVGADVTQANPSLNPERLIGFEAGFDYSPVTKTALRSTFFLNQVNDPILNATIGSTAAGGQLRQRRNIEETRIIGLENEIDCQPTDTIQFYFRHAFSDSRVRRSNGHPGLSGKRLAQVPRHVVTIGGNCKTWENGPEISANMRWSDAQFEDDLNQRILGSYPTFDLFVQQPIGIHGTCFVGIENLLDRKYADGITGRDLVTLGRPRSYQAGIRIQF